ncbi:hypothetical protein V5O48_012269 [Marasmius crinis-equi]|uniref:Uncharacterized protein n=1 Tax=Marasmius crinis-equi TaxID=585013 RepID=A0ABR3F3D5_9AGAR
MARHTSGRKSSTRKSKYGHSGRYGVRSGGDVFTGSMSRRRERVDMTLGRWSLEQERYLNMLRGLSFDARKQLMDLADHLRQEEEPIMNNDVLMDYDDDDNNDYNMEPLPVGEEGHHSSYAGGEHAFQELFTNLINTSQRKRYDNRDRNDRVQRQNEGWERQRDDMTTEYVRFKAGRKRADEEFEDREWEIRVMDFNVHETQTLRHTNPSKTINTSLIAHGLIGGSSEIPQIAFSLSLFEIYRQIHRVCPYFSIDSLSRTLQHIHSLPRDVQLEDQLRTGYDAYLAIMRTVQDRIDTATRLNRSEADYYSDVCSPCGYRLKEEPLLVPSMFVAIDGNNSLKLIDPAHRPGNTRQDDRTAPHPRWMEETRVDEFKDEVVNAQKAARASKTKKGKKRRKNKKKQPNASTSMAPEPDPEAPGDDPSSAEECSESESDSPVSAPAPCDDPFAIGDKLKNNDPAWLNLLETQRIEGTVNTCVERWKAAAPDVQKKMFEIFSIAGIFLSVCRHGHVLVMCDMVRSGELMKYPLATVDELINRYGEDLGVGYDIMCAFYTTLLRSEKLGAKVVAAKLHGVVPSFHGHAHNRKCQLSWHPQYAHGVGLEDFEECERTFSQSNRLASTTRMATPFHRRQAILEHFYFHDMDKHANSGNFIFQNYCQALKRKEVDGPVFDEACLQLDLSGEECERLLAQEKEYFERDYVEVIEDTQEMDYAEKLEKYWLAKANAVKATEAYKNMQRTSEGLTAQQIKSIESKYRTTFEAEGAAEEHLRVLEDDMDIVERWGPESEEYQETVRELEARRYRRVLDKLERLVVSRLFEFTKLNMSGVGYKQRQQISKALRSRAEAIRKALEEYNRAARTLTPPRPTLSFTQILEMVTLADFDLLKDSRLDITQLAWTDEQVRRTMQLHFGLLRADEEITRLNVEIRRLVTFMVDRHANYFHAIRRVKDSDPNLAVLIKKDLEYYTDIDGRVAERLELTSCLSGFTGSLIPGERIGRDPELTDTAPLPRWATSVLGLYRPQGGKPENAAQTTRPSEGVGYEEGSMQYSNREVAGAHPDGLLELVVGLNLNDGPSMYKNRVISHLRSNSIMSDIPVIRPLSLIRRELAKARYDRDMYDVELIYMAEKLASAKERLDIRLETADLLDNGGNPQLANYRRMSYRTEYLREVADLLGNPEHSPGRRKELTDKVTKLEREADDAYECPAEDDFLRDFIERKKLDRPDDDTRAVAKEVLTPEETESECESEEATVGP